MSRVIVCLAAVAIAAPSPARADPFDRLASWIRAELARDEAPSVAVAVARDGHIVWAEAFGHADRERAIPATPDTRYSLASISKPLTATGLMVLAERGLVDLDRPINDYLSGATLGIHAGRANDVTVRRIATHTAGLPVHHHFFVEGERSPPSMDETIRRYGHVVARPGDRFQYSNLGYGLLGHLLGLVGGQSYAAFMRDEVFRPLGMHRTSVGIPPDERGDYAVRYGRDGSPLPYYGFDHDGASAVFSSARDLARFALLHLERPLPGMQQVLSERTLREMQRSGTDARGPVGYGIGWQIQDLGRGRIVSHGGGMPGVSTSLTLVPSARLAIVALANASSSLPASITERLLGELTPVRGAVVSGRAPGGSSLGQRAPRPRARPGRHMAGRWTGRLVGGGADLPFRIRIDRSGEAVAALGDGEEAPMLHLAFDGDRFRGLLQRARLPTADAGRAEALYVTLIRRGDVLAGSLTAASSREPSSFALSHWVELQRVRD